MLDTWWRNIRNKKWTIKIFLEEFQLVLKCPSIRFDASLGSWLNIIHSSNDLIFLRLTVYLSTVFTIALKGSWEGNGRVELFLDQVSYRINVFFDNFGSEKTWKLGRRDVNGGHKSVDNIGEGVTVRKLKWWKFEVFVDFPS